MTSLVLGYDSNNTSERVELHKASRRQGAYVIAATGVGKSTSLRHLLLEDIKQHIGDAITKEFDELIKVGLLCGEKLIGKRLKRWSKSPYLATFVHIFKACFNITYTL